MKCGHLICELNEGPCELTPIGNDYGMGGHVENPLPPADRVALAQRILDGLDRGEITAELRRRKLASDLADLISLIRTEREECRHVQDREKIKAREAKLLSKLAAVVQLDDLGRAL